MAPTLRRVLLFALIVVGLALAAACANIANAQLATVISRQREIAVRLAMGATRGRVLRQWLTESVLLAVVATGAGLLIAVWARDGMLLLRPPKPGLQNLGPNLTLDWRVLGFAALVAGVVTILFGGLPALRAARVDVTTPLKDDGVTSTGSRRRTYAQGCVGGRASRGVARLARVGGLLVRSLAAASAFDVGFDSANLVIAEADTQRPQLRARSDARVLPRDARSRPRAARRPRRHTRRGGAARRIAGVARRHHRRLHAPERRDVRLDRQQRRRHELLRVMGIPIVSGRGFVDTDGDDGAAVVADRQRDHGAPLLARRQSDRTTVAARQDQRRRSRSSASRRTSPTTRSAKRRGRISMCRSGRC